MKQTVMEKEALQAPEVIARQFKENQGILLDICRFLDKNPPSYVVTIGRGSSDHACTFAKYLFETKLGLPTVSAAPSVLTLYGSELKLNGALVIGISQSGKSPDICDVMRGAKKSGATTIAIVNDVNSPLAKTAQFILPMLAGEEHAVAATKSYIASLSLLIQLVALYAKNKRLIKKASLLPERLAAAIDMDWSAALPILAPVKHTLVLGRGFGFPTAQEAALKFKETCVLHAEAFSGAEVLHGPFALIRKDHPYLMFTQGDNALEGMLHLAQRIKQLGGEIIVAASPDNIANNYFHDVSSLKLLLPPSLHPICDPLMTIQAFYLMIARLAVERGYNPDAPDNLQKITETV